MATRPAYQKQGSVDDDEGFFSSFSASSAADFKKRVSLAGSIIASRTIVPNDLVPLEETPVEREVETHNAHGKKVVARVRPFTGDEGSGKGRRIVSVTPGHRLTIVNPALCHDDVDKIANIVSSSTSNESAKVFQFTQTLWSFDRLPTNPREKAYVSQEGVHEAVGKDMVDYAVKGVSVCCFAYGHTCSGKTHTMFGSRSPAEYAIEAASEAPAVTEDMGLIPRVLVDIAATLLRAASKISMRVSFLEIYNERIRDLLGEGSAEETALLRVRESPTEGVFVEGLTKAEVRSKEELLRLVLQGFVRRSTAQTSRNEFSSRSHAIVTLEIVFPTDEDTSQQSKGRRRGGDTVRVQMTDLAGSEQDTSVADDSFGHERKSHRAEDNVVRGERKFIRTSLSTLGFIIQALDKPGAKNLPYRDSLLTWLLREALSGSSCTFMLATLSPAAQHYEETLLTLKYAQRLFSVGHKLRNVKSSFQTRDELSMMASFGSGGGEGALRPSQVRRISKARADDGPGARLDGEDEDFWTEEFRSLRGQIIDLEIELTNARTDKDSLLVELEEARRALVNSELLRKQQLLVPLPSPSADHDRERYEVQQLVRSKDERIEKLLSDLTSERLDRSATEMNVVRQIHRLMDRIDDLQFQLAEAQESAAAQRLAPSAEMDSETGLETDALRQVREAAEERVQRAEDAARTAKDALRTVMSLGANREPA